MDAALRTLLERQLQFHEASARELRACLSEGAPLSGSDRDAQPWDGVPLSDSRWITPKQAVFECSRDERTIARWAEEHGVGVKVGGRWAIWRPSLVALLNADGPLRAGAPSGREIENVRLIRET